MTDSHALHAAHSFLRGIGTDAQALSRSLASTGFVISGAASIAAESMKTGDHLLAVSLTKSAVTDIANQITTFLFENIGLDGATTNKVQKAFADRIASIDDCGVALMSDWLKENKGRNNADELLDHTAMARVIEKSVEESKSYGAGFTGEHVPNTVFGLIAEDEDTAQAESDVANGATVGFNELSPEAQAHVRKVVEGTLGDAASTIDFSLIQVGLVKG